ncbi:enoyl-CoA hydratase-related protein [Burkholderia alba]|uniref:enoyl-CoA hydratase-related protein n=1 Tax=Burkholderia alba TaxID=2683677 RepID=UPI002B05BDF8|nr:enoyl-CoA hydratase-related protein [Burkholderia alba]
MRENLSVETGVDGVAEITLHAAGHEADRWIAGLATDLAAAVEELAAHKDVVGAVILSGRGFMAGARIRDLPAGRDAGLTAAQAAARVAPVHAAFRLLERCGKPVAAAIDGPALGAGFELGLACHYRVLADDPRCVVGLPDVRVGLIPCSGGTQRLPRRIGIERALPLMLTGRAVAPAEALSLGLVDTVVAPERLMDTARRWVLAHPGAQQPWDVKGYRVPGGAGALAPHAAASFGLGLARVRRDTRDRAPAPLALLSAVYEGTQLPIDRALALEAKLFGRLVTDPAACEPGRGRPPGSPL